MLLPFPLSTASLERKAWKVFYQKKMLRNSCYNLAFVPVPDVYEVFKNISGSFPNECGWGSANCFIEYMRKTFIGTYNTEGTYSINQWNMSDEVFVNLKWRVYRIMQVRASINKHKFYVAALLLMHMRTSLLAFGHHNRAISGSVDCFSLLYF